MTISAPSTIRLGLAGGIATLLANGIARFAYTPLIPALADAQWFTISQANYLGTINFVGYVVGAASAHAVATRLGERRALFISLVLTLVALYACALNWGFGWYALWRFTCGVTGAFLIVIAATAALSRVPVRDRPLTGALVFSGVGLGIAASGTIVPWLIRFGVAATWLGLALFSTVLTVWSWYGVWRKVPPRPVSRPAGGAGTQEAGWPTAAVLLILFAYALNAIGFIPHSLFWVDYIARELDQGLAMGSMNWTVFGLGAAAGSTAAGWMAARIGFRPGLALTLTIFGIAVSLPIFSDAPAVLLVSSAVVGMSTLGTVALTSGALFELTPSSRQQQAWGWATVSFALLQAASSYTMAWTHDMLGTYRPLFIVSSAALLIAAGCVWATVARPAWRDV